MDDLVRQLMQGREWQDLGELHDKDGAMEFAALYRAAFVDNPAGARILEHWVKTTLMQPTVYGRSYAEDAVREGRADMVRGILKQIHLANTGGQ